MAIISNLVVKITTDTKGLKKGIKSSSLAVKNFANSTKNSMDKVGSSVKTAFLAFAAGASIVSGLTSIIRKGREFSASIADLSAITGATGKDLEFLTAASKEFGITTTLSATQAAEAFKLVASAKPDLLENAEALKAVTKEAIALAEASGSSLPAAARTLGSSLNQFGASADQAGRFINVLAAGSKLGASEVMDTASALEAAGIVASQAGLSFEVTNAAIQALAQDSIKGAKAGTGLRNVLTILQTQADDKLNPALVGLSAALDNLSAKNLSTKKLVKLFGRENLVTASSLLKNKESLKSLSIALKGTNVAYEQAAVKANSFDGKLKSLSSAIEGAALNLFSQMKPALTSVIAGMTNLARWVSENASVLASLGKVLGSGAALIAGLIAVKLIILAVSTTLGFMSAAALVASGSLTVLGAGAAALVTSLTGITISATAARVSLTVLKTAASVLFAAFAGWQIGTFIRNEFQIARVAGLAFVGSVLVGFENLKFGVSAVWTTIKFGWNAAIVEMKKVFASFLVGVGSALSNIPGLDSASDSILKFSERLRPASNATGSLSETLQALGNSRNSEVDKIKDHITALISEELQITKTASSIKKLNESMNQEKSKVNQSIADDAQQSQGNRSSNRVSFKTTSLNDVRGLRASGVVVNNNFNDSVLRDFVNTTVDSQTENNRRQDRR